MSAAGVSHPRTPVEYFQKGKCTDGVAFALLEILRGPGQRPGPTSGLENPSVSRDKTL